MPDAVHDEQVANSLAELAENLPAFVAELRAGELDGNERIEVAGVMTELAHGLLTTVVGAGDIDPLVQFFAAACMECSDRETVLCGTPEERANWAIGHARQTGHEQWKLWEEFRTATGDRPLPLG